MSYSRVVEGRNVNVCAQKQRNFNDDKAGCHGGWIKSRQADEATDTFRDMVGACLPHSFTRRRLPGLRTINNPEISLGHSHHRRSPAMRYASRALPFSVLLNGLSIRERAIRWITLRPGGHGPDARSPIVEFQCPDRPVHLARDAQPVIHHRA